MSNPTPEPTASIHLGNQVNLKFNDSHAQAFYANVCRVSSTPEEVIIDLALNPNPAASGEQELEVGQRIVMNHFTAKRLTTLLGVSLKRHEEMFGHIEVDVRKRVVGKPGQSE